METDSPTIPKRTLADILFILFLRLVAVSCFWFGLQYWAMLVGYSLVGAGRFDLLSLPWKVASTSLAVLFPVASLGLWLTVSWGPVIWVLAAGGQILMYGLLPDIFRPQPDDHPVACHGRRRLLDFPPAAVAGKAPSPPPGKC